MKHIHASAGKAEAGGAMGLIGPSSRYTGGNSAQPEDEEEDQ